MNILFHHRTQGHGVERVHILGMVSGFMQAGHTVEIVSPPGVTVSPNNGTETVSHQEIMSPWKKVVRFLPGLFFELMELFYNGVSFRRLARQMKKTRFDMIYERYAFLHFSGALLAARHRIPLYLELNFTSMTPLYRKRSRLIGPIQKALERRIFSAADGLIVVSTSLKEKLIEDGYAPHRILVTPNAVDSQFLEEQHESVRKELKLDSKRVIGFVGGFYPWHGVDMLIQILPDLVREVPNVAALLIGDGPLRLSLQKQVETMGLTDCVRFTGQIAHAILPRYVAAFDVGVLPDSNDYASPMKVYEYMAMGKPVIAPKLAPLEEGIIDGKVGLLFCPQNKKALAEAIITLLTDEAKRHEMGEAARCHVRQNHTWKNNAAAVLAMRERQQEGGRE